MNRTTFALVALLLMAAVVSACTWVKTTPGGEAVRVAEGSEVGDCGRKGEVNVSLKSRVGGFERKPGKVATELATLARNEAATMGANTVVAESLVKDGRQQFGAYECQR
ncbi:MAG: DUF4156 domain-containing protein [Burkholderiales bacterium]